MLANGAAALATLRSADGSAPHRPLPRLRGRDREGACLKIECACHPLPTPPPQAGEGADRVCRSR
jgi:hypothetical protein